MAVTLSTKGQASSWSSSLSVAGEDQKKEETTAACKRKKKASVPVLEEEQKVSSKKTVGAQGNEHQSLQKVGLYVSFHPWLR